MSNPDRPNGHGNLPAMWSPGHLPAAMAPAAPAWDDAALGLDDTSGGGRFKLSPRAVLRAARRYWWQLLSLWLLLSVPLAYLAATRIKPTFYTGTIVEIKPAAPELFGERAVEEVATATMLETQVQRMLQRSILENALTLLGDKTFPSLHNPNVIDPVAELGKLIRVSVVRNTNLISVGMTSEHRGESEALVQAVVKSFKTKAVAEGSTSIKEQKEEIKDFQKQAQDEVKTKKAELMALLQKSQALDPSVAADGVIDQEKLKSRLRNQVSYDEFKRQNDQLGSLEMELLTREKQLARLRSQKPAIDDGNGQTVPEQVIAAELARDPELLSIRQQYDRAKDQYEQAKRRTRKGNDPAMLNAQSQMSDLAKQYQALMAQKEPVLRARMNVQAPLNDPIEAEIRSLEQEVDELKTKKNEFANRIEELKLETRTAGLQEIEIGFAQVELARANEKLAKIDSVMQQIEFELTKATTSQIVIPEDKYIVEVPVASSASKALIVAMIPVAVMTALLGLFTLLDLSSGRVADPDDLPGRVKVDVIGVVPPLPSPKGGWRRGQGQLQRQVDEFIQSLDHLRVRLCAGIQPGGGPGRRVVMITSAISGEGKTTLAAQLAGRCANAGMQTLLIDADLRRPRLGQLLEVPEGPGLMEVLAGEVDPEAAMVVIGNAGGFHLLPAGTVGTDPSRLLQGEALGRLMERLRESFDIVIVDVPPVLAVPDALLIGRWTEGSVLAVRRDTSRFPLVERAKKRLATVGVPVLGAVVSGVRSTEVAYGGAYSYTGSGADSGRGGAAPATVDDAV